jgi:hypothetical protein
MQAPRPVPRTPHRRPARIDRIKGIKIAPAAAAVAAVLLLAAFGIMAIAHVGPFASAHNALASVAGSVGGGAIADPGRSASPTPRHHPGAGHARKPTPRKSASLPAITASPSSPAKPSGGSGGGGGALIPYGPNLVADGNFTDPTLTAWNYGVYQAVITPGAGFNGANAVQLYGNPEAGIAETITGLKSGGHYVITGWIEANVTPVYIGARDDASGKEVDVSSASASWAKLSVNFIVPRGQSSAVVFCVQRRGGTGYCSNISVRALHSG